MPLPGLSARENSGLKFLKKLNVIQKYRFGRAQRRRNQPGSSDSCSEVLCVEQVGRKRKERSKKVSQKTAIKNAREGEVRGRGVGDSQEDRFEEVDVAVDAFTGFPELRMESQYARGIALFAATHD